MEFGLDTYAKATFKRGKKASSEGIQLNDDKVIDDLDQEAKYAYLGIEEGDNTGHQKVRNEMHKIQEKYQACIAINTLAVPVVTYSYEVLH